MEDLGELTKWQAASHPELAERPPEELFPTEFAERYKRLHHDLWFRIIRVHGTIHTLEKLYEFPFAYLYGPSDMQFWSLVFHNFGDMAIVLLHGSWNDEGKNANTIPKLKNEIVKEPWNDERLKKVFLGTLRERRFDQAVHLVAKRVGELRDKRIAHRLVNTETGRLLDSPGGMSLGDLRALFDAIHALFGAVSFGASYVTLAGDLMPGTVGGEPVPTCLDKVLDAVARNSELANRPERKQAHWKDFRRHMPAGVLEAMNDLRRRVGLPPA